MTGTSIQGRHEKGFSLVEVTIAMGIVATVLIALLALLPYGMDNVREAKSTQVQTRIANEIIGELQVADWGREPGFSRLRSWDGLIRRYDAEGSLIEDTQDQNKADTIYKVRVDVPVAQQVPLPGQAAGQGGQYLRRVSIKIAYAPGDREVDFDADQAPLPYKSFTSEIAKMARNAIQ